MFAAPASWRATTSRILLTQMVGRALRGPKFGGTDVAYVVSFVDNWQHLINWATYDELGGYDHPDHIHASRVAIAWPRSPVPPTTAIFAIQMPPVQLSAAGPRATA